MTKMVYKDEENGDKLKIVAKEGRRGQGDLYKVIYKEGDRQPQSPERKPRSPGRRSRSPGRKPRSPGRKPQSPGRKPRSPGKPRPQSPGRKPRSPGKKPQPKPAHAEEGKKHPDWWWAAHGPQSEGGYHYTPYDPVHIETREYTPPAPAKKPCHPKYPAIAADKQHPRYAEVGAECWEEPKPWSHHQ